MPEPPHLAPLNAEEQRFYSEPLPDSHPISKGEPSHPAEETHFGRLYSRSRSPHRLTTSLVEVSKAPSPPYTVLTMSCFPPLRRRMVDQNLFEAIRKSFSMVSPNSSQARVFASATAEAVIRLACQYPSAASRVPLAKKAR